MLKKLTLLSLAWLLTYILQAQPICTTSQNQVIIAIVPDNYALETSWSLYDDITGVKLDTGLANSDTICVDTSRCLRFNIYDAFGDGICCAYGIGSYTIKLNGNTVATGGHFQHIESVYFNCPAGHSCMNAVVAHREDTIIAPLPNTWYSFTADSTGIYDISTCGLANCDTKIYIYDHCTGLVFDNNQTGTTYFNDDACGGVQSNISGAMIANHTYYIRIGQYDTACIHHTIPWHIHFVGPIKGCMDSTSCTYNPLATIPDTTCVYPPSILCPAPDLAIDVPMLHSSLYLDTLMVNNGDCYVNEGCLAGYGMRRLIRFSTHIRNIGEQDYFIGAPDTTTGHQFVWDPCHQHWHYVGYAEYLLYDHLNNEVQVGFKNGFCVLDLECGGGGIGKFSCGNMGITSGCGDIYVNALPCQWIDITTIDTGNYTLVVRVNWNRKPDKLGHYEKRYDNNWAQLCLKIYYDSTGHKNYDTLPTCPLYVDCAGDTFGSAIKDCAGTCNGTKIRGDLNVNHNRDTTDMLMYLNGITADTLAYSTCNDLNGDGAMTIVDIARLNGCLRQMDSSLTTLHNPQSSQHICQFPYNIFDPLDTVLFSIANVDWLQHYIDISVYNPVCKLMGYEIRIGGAKVDSVRNLATGNYVPDVRHSYNGHILELSDEDQSLYRQVAALNFLRVYFSHITDSTICIAQVVDVVDDNYQQVLGDIGAGCVTYHQVDTTTHHNGIKDQLSEMNISLIPNPTKGIFELYMTGKSLYGATTNIYNSLGELVFESKRNEGLSNKMMFDLSNEASGVYQLHITLNGESVTKRFVIAQ